MHYVEESHGLVWTEATRHHWAPRLVQSILGHVPRLSLVVEAEHEDIGPRPQQHPGSCC